MGDLYISLKDTTVRKVTVNEPHRLDIDGKFSFKPGFTGAGLLAMYFNLDLPPGGSALRLAIANGGIRCWFEQQGGSGDTGNLGPLAPAGYGPAHFLMAHSWPHTVDEDVPWEFYFQVYALSKTNKAVAGTVELETREIKIIADPTH
jgi:hypothetical protein